MSPLAHPTREVRDNRLVRKGEARNDLRLRCGLRRPPTQPSSRTLRLAELWLTLPSQGLTALDEHVNGAIRKCLPEAPLPQLPEIRAKMIAVFQTREGANRGPPVGLNCKQVVGEVEKTVLQLPPQRDKATEEPSCLQA